MSQHNDWAEMQTALRTASDIGFAEEMPTGEQAEFLVDALRRALVAAQGLTTGPGATGCRIHPHGAIDPLYGDKDDPLPPGWGKCLLCNDRRRRAASARRRAMPR
ncbi:hypothetical protein [Streptomyces alkaliphilus]|uniref:hypothetical protein n=1 Tax=Streptomyces alkaliphilus TaxID=1472722 RepID=UPI001180C563|nr:hypothetical protein [Streptomyces alkaliphilus]MQS10305.1 hypothetical protein [Streptomyces alkaliphilus]